MMHDLTREEIWAGIDHVVKSLLETAGLEKPPIDAIALAQHHLGMTICIDRRQSQRGRAQRAAGRRQIFVRPEPSLERHQWTVAHEIGEHLRPQLLSELEIASTESAPMFGESLANIFAGRLLVPACWFGADAARTHFELPALKKLYSTASHEILAMRLLDLPEPAIITIVDNNHISRRRSNAWHVRRELEPPEKICQEYVHYYSRARCIQENGWTVQGWPVHQEDWKREILRSVVAED